MSGWRLPLCVPLIGFGIACTGVAELAGTGPTSPPPAPTSGSPVTAAAVPEPGAYAADGLWVSFGEGSTTGARLVVSPSTTLPRILGTPEEHALYDQLHLVSTVWDITDPGTGEPFDVEVRFDPVLAGTDDLFLLAVSRGQVTAPRVFAADLAEGYVIAEGDHFSTWFVVAATLGLTTLVYVAWKAYSFTSNEGAPWKLIEPGHPKIDKYLADHRVTLPRVGPGIERVLVPGYEKRFAERTNTVGNRVVHLTGKRGSEVLDESEVACWDLTTLFGSMLYTLDPSLGPKIRLVKGTADGTRHSWIEVVLDGRVFVVNTGRTDAFELVDRDVLYAEQKLVPSHMYTRDAGSLKAYDPAWFAAYAGADPAARIEALKARHAELQVELEALGAKGTSLTGADEARMTEVRAEQKAIYEEVMTLKRAASK